MPLEDYRRKRRFQRTPEPAGQSRRGRTHWRFVVQKHAARRLHYDFRLEVDGVLKSWAVPRGPSLDPKERRLAVQVEDHPVEYGDFEGVIPEGEYGGGTVVLWDRGTWEPEGDAAEGLTKGRLKFRLAGEKLRGRWTLVRMQPKPGERGENWLLIKERDDEARPLSEFDVLEEQPNSAATGRTLRQIAVEKSRTWHSNRADKAAKKSARTSVATRARKSKIASPARLPGADRAPLLEPLQPQLAELASQVPEGEQWFHEIKFDGYRILAWVDRGRVTLRTRNKLDWTTRFPELAAGLAELPARQAVLDGEVVALLPSGASSFQELQNALSEDKTGQLIYQAFDLLFLDGYDLRGVPLEARKAKLAELLTALETRRIQYTDHLEGSGPEFFGECCRIGLEGIISKRRDRPYRSGRGPEWLKMKCVEREEFVIGGFTRPSGSRQGFGALLVGYFDKQGRFLYAGKVGTGFSDRLLIDLRDRLRTVEQDGNPFANLPTHEADRGTRWVRPELVGQVEFNNWTEEGIIRHAAFQGLREDVPAKSVVRETPDHKSSRPKSAKSHRGGPVTRLKDSSPAPTGLTPEQRKQLEGVRLTNPDRVLYPGQGITKIGLVSYYLSIADWILPHVTGRPISLVRCPEGHDKDCFYQKHAAAGTPEHIRRIMIQEKEKPEPYLVIDDLAGLLSLVQMGVLEIHPWGSRADNIERPDRMIFDLDPDPTVAWPQVIEAALAIRDQLADLGLVSFVKTTGGKGLHIVVPMQRRSGWPEVKQFAKAFVERIVADSPARYTANMSKAARRGRIYIDFHRNDRGATAVAAYSTRARPGAPVSVPLAWDELSPAIRSDHFNINNLPARLASLESDPWEEMDQVRQSLTASLRRKLGLRPPR